MSDRPRARVLSVVVAALAAAAAMAPSAAAKGLDLSLSADPQRPSVGRQVEIALRGAADPEVTRPCRAMRVVVVAPGVSVKRALRSLEGRADSRRIGRWGAFRLASLRSVGELRWEGTFRPHRPGRWTLVVPNWCAVGYGIPEGGERLELDVRPAAARWVPPTAGRVPVPAVVGLPQTEAQCALSAAGLSWRLGSRPPSIPPPRFRVTSSTS